LLSSGTSVIYNYTPGWDTNFSFLVGGPFIQSATLSQGSTFFYTASTSLGALVPSTNIPIDNNQYAAISATLAYNTPMNTDYEPTVMLKLAGSAPYTVAMNGNWDSDEAQTWSGTTSNGVIPMTYVGPVTMLVTGAQDANENPGGTSALGFTVAGLPYVAGVTVSQGGTVYHIDSWPPFTGNGCCLPATSPVIGANNPVAMDVGAHFDIHFSQPMNTNIKPAIQALYKNGGPFYKWSNPGWEADSETFGVDSDASFPADLQAGDSVTLAISGAFDAGNRPMTGNPVIVSHMNGTSNGGRKDDWAPTPNPGPDTYHVFQVATALRFGDFV
jgi:hypothetical protein